MRELNELILRLISLALMVWGGWVSGSGEWRDGFLILILAFVMGVSVDVSRMRRRD